MIKLTAVALCLALAGASAEDRRYNTGYGRNNRRGDDYNRGDYGNAEPESASYDNYNGRDNYGDYRGGDSAPYADSERGYYNNGEPEPEYTRYRFPPRQAYIDPKYYLSVLNDFQGCYTHKCSSIASQGYGNSVSDSLQTVAKYTACVTECSAFQFMHAIRDLKNLIAEIYDISSAKLTSVRKYLADDEYFDMLGNRTRIGSSCCLPKQEFVSWDRLMLPVTVSSSDVSSQIQNAGQRMISVADYLRICLSDGKLNGYTVSCSPTWVLYLEALQSNIGTLVLAPHCRNSFPNNACCTDRQSNPRATEFPADVCVAYECVKNGKSTYLDIPLIRAFNGRNCSSDILKGSDGSSTIVKYQRVAARNLKYYTVTTGFPSAAVPGNLAEAVANLDREQLPTCSYSYGFAIENGSFFDPMPAPTSEVIDSTDSCPSSGNFEYCNAQQYVGYLEKQLFDVSKCNINDLGRSNYDVAAGLHFTLACQYRVASLKCDCMESVLNCYRAEYAFTSSIGKILGKAASIMCGFILCQQPKIFTLFGEMNAINKAQIMRSILLQAGAMIPAANSVSPASYAVASFALGMIAFVAVKATIKRRKPVDMEGGYHNLI